MCDFEKEDGYTGRANTTALRKHTTDRSGKLQLHLNENWGIITARNCILIVFRMELNERERERMKRITKIYAHPSSDYVHLLAYHCIY